MSGSNNQPNYLCLCGVVLFLLFAAPNSPAAEQNLLVTGTAGQIFTIEGSNDFQTWETIQTIVNSTGTLEIPASQLGDFDFCRVVANASGAGEPVAVGLAVFENSIDQQQLEQLKLDARDRALTAIAGAQNQYSQQELETLFCSFATQETFNIAAAAANSAAAATASEASVNRILGVLSSQVSTLSQADLDAISSQALSTGLVGGIISGGGSSTDAINAVVSATQNLNPSAQQAASTIAQSAAIAALAAQLTGVSGNDLLQSILSAVSGLLNP